MILQKIKKKNNNKKKTEVEHKTNRIMSFVRLEKNRQAFSHSFRPG